MDEYAEWKGWWPAGSPRAGQRLQVHEWPISRVLQGEDLAAAVVEIEPFGEPGLRRTILIRAAAIRDRDRVMLGAVAANMASRAK